MIEQCYSFLDYIQGNCELNLMVAIDFTASNGNKNNRNSLHYRDNYTMNEYERAIASVGEILISYDTNKRVPVWGFGGVPNDQS
jgi:hypothetical protein|mmetsp:Transcript_25619/g.4298  ORF Transcript_25619/g.4298 Transcript_25619/m.4298 type:complete len:84 (+) Transcript_25619:22-273(+)